MNKLSKIIIVLLSSLFLSFAANSVEVKFGHVGKPGSLFSAGFLSGFMGTSSSIGGPPIALVLQHQENDFIRANMAAFFCVSCLMSLLMLATIDRFRLEHILISLPLMPATLLGYWVAMKTLHKISHQNLRRASLALCTIAGSIAIASYWL